MFEDFLQFHLDHMQEVEQIADAIGLMGCRSFVLSNYSPEDLDYIQEIVREDYKMNTEINITEVEK